VAETEGAEADVTGKCNGLQLDHFINNIFHCRVKTEDNLYTVLKRNLLLYHKNITLFIYIILNREYIYDNDKLLFTEKALHQVGSVYSNKLSELPVNCYWVKLSTLKYSTC